MKQLNSLLLVKHARRIACAFGLSVLLGSGSCGAAANYWAKATSGIWEEPQWSLGVLPDSTQSVAIINSGCKAVAINPATPVHFPASMTVNDLTVAAFGSGQNTLLLNFAGTAVSLHALNGSEAILNRRTEGLAIRE